MAFHIANAYVDALTRKLAAFLGRGVVETVELAVTESLEARGISVEDPKPEGLGTEDDLADVLRADALSLKRLREQHFKKPSSTGYLPGQIKHFGAVVASSNIVMKGTSVLQLLIDLDRLDLAVESRVVEPRFSHLFHEEVVARAKRNLLEGKAIIALRNKG